MFLITGIKMRISGIAFDCNARMRISPCNIISHSLRSADAFPVVASLPPKNSVCEPEWQNDFRDVKPFVLM